MPLFRNKPWIIYGDFNEILDVEDHSNSSDAHISPQGMRDFQDVTRHCSMFDLMSYGPRYTWTNKRTEGIICKKLERGLVNNNWLQNFPNSYCIFDSRGLHVLTMLVGKSTLGLLNRKERNHSSFQTPLQIYRNSPQ